MRDEDRREIERMLSRSPQSTVFVDEMEKWIAALNRPGSYWSKPQISRPRSAAAVQTIEAARKAAAILDRKNREIVKLPAYRWSRELAVLDKLSDDLRQYEVFLAELTESMRPLGSTGQSRRLNTERYALRGLMWLFTRFLPNEKISYVPTSRFSRIADYMLKEIKFNRVDIRELIKQEREGFLSFLEQNPISDDSTDIRIQLEP